MKTYSALADFTSSEINILAPVRPMPLVLSLILFGMPTLLFLIIQRLVLPFLGALGVHPLANFFVMMSPHFLFFFGALWAYKLEGNPWRWPILAERFRLVPLGAKGWAWAAAAALGNVGLYLLVYTAARPILQWLHDLWPDPAILSRILGDATSFAGFPLSGNVWLLGIFLVGYFFNVMGEELWWRGYILPRQKLVHGSRTWLVHGFLWAGFHLFTPYNALMVLPGALWVSWIVQKQHNTWIFVIAHGLLNGLAMIRIIAGIVG